MDLHSKGSRYLTTLALTLVLFAVAVLAQVCLKNTTCRLPLVVEPVQEVWQRVSIH